MMSNEQILDTLRLTAQLMELHEENAFKIRGIQNAVFNLEKFTGNLSSLAQAELEQIEGVGKGIAAKINELNTTNTTAELEALLKATPAGVIELFQVKGIGPKKIKALWKELGINSKDELMQACVDNRVAKLKGFGEKTQETIKQALLYSQQQEDRFMYAELEESAMELEKKLKEKFGKDQVLLSGEMRRGLEVIDTIQLLVKDHADTLHSVVNSIPELTITTAQSGPFSWRGKENKHGAQVEILAVPAKDWAAESVMNSASREHLGALVPDGKNFVHFLRDKAVMTEEDLYKELGLPFIHPELREGLGEVEMAKENKLPELVTWKDLKGTLHNHSDWSDGLNTLEQMAKATQDLGLEYFGIADHSKSAFYANGLDERRIKEQHALIDELNKKFTPFRILKGIESDILNDGALDYADDVLASFDYVVASVHSNLKMNEAKATERLLKAVENKYTTVLGHMTGRLLLQREGYPVNTKAVIDACAEQKVVMELNAHPRRLDIDWRWIPYCLEKGVMISINPDAHETGGLLDMHYGLKVARKGHLTREMTFNALSLPEMLKYLGK